MLFVSDNACELFKLELDCKTVPHASLVVDSFTWNVSAENRRISRLTKHKVGKGDHFQPQTAANRYRESVGTSMQRLLVTTCIFRLAVQVTLLIQMNGNVCVMK